MADKDELAAQKARNDELERRIAELERKAKPPEPFKPDPNWKPYDPTANMSMPPSALRAMVEAERSFGMMKEVALRDARAPTNPGSTIPSSQKVSNAQPERGTGWAKEIPLGPPPGINHVDAQLIADEVRQRAEMKRKLGEP